jgi:hypothetical protein
MKIIIAFIVLILSAFSSYSQCVRQISTNPNNPYNEEWESWYPSDTYAGSFINTGFSWYPNSSILIPKSQDWNTPFRDPNGGDLTMEWPFASDNGGHTSYLYRRIDPETIGDEYPRGEDIPIELRDYHWEDGWELLYLNIGRLPNGDLIDDKHLPGVPSANDVTKDGIDLAQLNAILLQKLEELTLHLIELQKQVNTLRDE